MYSVLLLVILILTVHQVSDIFAQVLILCVTYTFTKLIFMHDQRSVTKHSIFNANVSDARITHFL